MKQTAIALLLIALSACAPTSNTACDDEMADARARHGEPERVDQYNHASGWVTIRWSWPDQGIAREFRWDSSMYIASCEVSTYTRG